MDLISRMNDLREEMLRKKIPLDLQHECIEYLLASYQEQPSLRGHVSHPQYDEMMKKKCQTAYDTTIKYLNERVGYKKT